MTNMTDDQGRRLLETLRSVELFSELDDDTLRLLVDKAELVEYQPGDYLCTEGELGDRMFVIDLGEVSVLKRGHDGKPAQIAVLRPGEIAGELSLFGQSTRNATLQARRQATVLELGHADFQQLLDQHPEIARALLMPIVQQLRRQNWMVAELLTRD
jgi:CRP-like cAMP-binding protein